MRARVYVDGFNLYYGLKRFEINRVNYRWLDLQALAKRLRPHDEITGIRYFTARIQARDDPSGPVRQDIYLQALKTSPVISVHEGEFRTDKRLMKLVKPSESQLYANVWRTEEKGSDVSLATHLVADGFRNRFDLGIVITNDSDLIEPINLVTRELEVPVGVFNPQGGFSRRLKNAATFYTQLSEHDFATSQFPDVIFDHNGRRITKPVAWNVTDEHS